MAIYFVYCLLDPTKKGDYLFENVRFDYEPFYIGKGSKTRIRQHFSPAQLKRDKNKKKVNKILKIKKLGYDVIKLKIYENLEEIESLNIEKKLIQLIGRNDLHKGPLTNLTDGGEVGYCKFYELNIETQEKLRKLRSNNIIGSKNPMKNKETSKKVSDVLKNKNTKHSDEYKKNMSEKIKNSEKHKKGTQSEKNRKTHKEIQEKNMKPTIQYDKNMNYINEFESIKDASRQLNIRKGDISAVIHNRQKSAGGFIFKLKNNTNIC